MPEPKPINENMVSPLDQLESLEQQKLLIEQQINQIKRNLRKGQSEAPTQQHLEQEAEYKRQLEMGLNPSPLVPRVDLEELVGSETYEAALQAEEFNCDISTTLRGIPLTFRAPSRRALWQSIGQEYIEPDLLDFIDEIPSDGCYFDIGASTGIFAIYAAAKGIKTACFEPEAQNFNLLNYNAYLNRAAIQSNIHCFNIALANQDSIDYMYIKKFEEAGHLKILGTPQARGEPSPFEEEYRQSVITMKLDSFLNMSDLEAPTHLKIDVDGAEQKLLSGMVDLLANRKLHSILIEINENDPESNKTLDLIYAHEFKLDKKQRVQNYFGEFNYLLRR